MIIISAIKGKSNLKDWNQEDRGLKDQDQKDLDQRDQNQKDQGGGGGVMGREDQGGMDERDPMDEGMEEEE